MEEVGWWVVGWCFGGRPEWCSAIYKEGMECSRKYEKEGMKEQPSRIGFRYSLWKLLTSGAAR
jgi:hypothetical protein